MYKFRDEIWWIDITAWNGRRRRYGNDPTNYTLTSATDAVGNGTVTTTAPIDSTNFPPYTHYDGTPGKYVMMNLDHSTFSTANKCFSRVFHSPTEIGMDGKVVMIIGGTNIGSYTPDWAPVTSHNNYGANSYDYQWSDPRIYFMNSYLKESVNGYGAGYAGFQNGCAQLAQEAFTWNYNTPPYDTQGYDGSNYLNF